jgi:hypothetical protein
MYVCVCAHIHVYMHVPHTHIVLVVYLWRVLKDMSTCVHFSQSQAVSTLDKDSQCSALRGRGCLMRTHT